MNKRCFWGFGNLLIQNRSTISRSAPLCNIHNFVIMVWLKNYSCHNVFDKKNINTSDVLRFIQMHTVLAEKKYDLFKAAKQLQSF